MLRLKKLSPLFTSNGLRNYSRESVSGKVLAIRREDASPWERRAPFAPQHVRSLVKNGVKVLIQPSNRRAYPMQAYINAGAQIQEDISDAPVIMGVKQVAIDDLLPNKTYCFFSHTIKAQEANMPLLDTVLERHIRLIDYEKLTDSKGQRVVAFGNWAGVAGMINIFHGLGLRLLALGHHTPFMHIGPAHNYRNSGMAIQAIRDAGYEIAMGMLPRSIGPLTFVFTGSGNVSQGAQEIFQQMPYEYVNPNDLPEVVRNGSLNKVYATVVSRDDHLRSKETGEFSAEEYENHPERYYSTFATTIAPYASVIVNGIYWAVNSPKLLTIPDAKRLLQPTLTPWLPHCDGCPTLPHRLLAICDISADPGGSIEFMTECTTIDTPFCLYDADQHQNSERAGESSSPPPARFPTTPIIKESYSFAGDGVLVCSIDNMPTQLPLESTDFFGDLLLPYMHDIICSDATTPLENHKFNPVVQNSIIASNGTLTPNFEYITELRKTSKSKKKAHSAANRVIKKVLVLGAGYVAEPLVEYLARDENIHITIASALHHQAEAIARFSNTEAVPLDVSVGLESLEKMVGESNLVVSLLPYNLHPKVAEVCIKKKVNMVTASYLTPEMKKLHQQAKDADITIVNEVGLDPGIDHLLAMECFDNVKMNGGKITSFVSYCGGLPAPECSENPLRYKFSWSPRGVLLNTLSMARYEKNGEVIEVPSGGALLETVRDMNFLPGFNLEGFANRDSLPYKDIYGIQTAHTILRGTLRYKGFTEAAKGLNQLGLLNMEQHPMLHPRGPEISWKQYITNKMGYQQEMMTSNVKNMLLEQVGMPEKRVSAMENLGLLDDEAIKKMGTPLDTLTHYLANRLSYSTGEKDVIILRHDIGVQWPDNKTEDHRINLVVYGDPNGYSAMAKTVGYPAAIAAKMVLEGEIQTRGMVVPMAQEVYKPMLKRLKLEGISCTEDSK